MKEWYTFCLPRFFCLAHPYIQHQWPLLYGSSLNAAHNIFAWRCTSLPTCRLLPCGHQAPILVWTQHRQLISDLSLEGDLSCLPILQVLFIFGWLVSFFVFSWSVCGTHVSFWMMNYHALPPNTFQWWKCKILHIILNVLPENSFPPQRWFALEGSKIYLSLIITDVLIYKKLLSRKPTRERFNQTLIHWIHCFSGYTFCNWFVNFTTKCICNCTRKCTCHSQIKPVLNDYRRQYEHLLLVSAICFLLQNISCENLTKNCSDMQKQKQLVNRLSNGKAFECLLIECLIMCEWIRFNVLTVV